MSERKEISMDPRYILRLAGTLLAITAVTALLLGLVNYVTDPIIKAMEEEKKNAAMAQVLEADTYEKVEDFTPTAMVSALYEAIKGGETIGYVADVTSNGYGGAISITVGVDREGYVSGVSVTSHSETQGVGSKVVGDQSVLDRFKGLAGPVTLNSGDNAFDGVTGATVSSRAVTNGVNAALEAAGAYLG